MEEVKLYWPQNDKDEKLDSKKKQIKESVNGIPKTSNLLFHSDNLVAMKSIFIGGKILNRLPSAMFGKEGLANI